ncbi:ribbon-helix-helix protein, CopG family [Microbacterium sp. 5K110]|jgi:16S rRNA U516 pseudouridylate synthase RsuA-like enzyme|uniref:ribbon-helix-helix protein, CopG family n=1 Tax=unclassified Microbacterium TaxID=2609290 RepID=UPI0010FD14D2|nr:ribbon-helix-helix protein, CopG family [Microbacterium sp. 5K110]TLF32586.1 ribbon-helix-helix protein, CopG family [Microbacterium sp. 5K110]
MTDYDDLAARAEAGQLQVKAGTVRRGPAAAQEAQQLLLAATGADNLNDAVTIARGRPRLDGSGTVAVTWKVRATESLDREVRTVAKARGVTVSQLVREAVANYVHPTEANAPALRP